MVRATPLYRASNYGIHARCLVLFGRTHAEFRRQFHFKDPDAGEPSQHQTEQVLVRDYVGRQLAEYYAQPAEYVVGCRGSTINNSSAATTSQPSNPLSSLWGEWHWKQVFQKLYDTREGHWLTPVELFKPHYSHIMANFCSQQATLLSSVPSKSSDRLELVELGCGRGTNAGLILSYLKTTKPEIYEQVESYTLIKCSNDRLGTRNFGQSPS
jgi:hypothetical protein